MIYYISYNTTCIMYYIYIPEYDPSQVLSTLAKESRATTCIIQNRFE